MPTSRLPLPCALVACAVLAAPACSPPADEQSPEPPLLPAQAVAAIATSTPAARDHADPQHGHVTLVDAHGRSRRIDTKAIGNTTLAYRQGVLYFPDRLSDYLVDREVTTLRRPGVEKQVAAATFTGIPSHDYVSIFNGPFGADGAYTFTVSTRRSGKTDSETTVLKAGLADIANCDGTIYALEVDMDSPGGYGRGHLVRLDLEPSPHLTRLAVHGGPLDGTSFGTTVPCRAGIVHTFVRKGDSKSSPAEKRAGMDGQSSWWRRWDTRTQKVIDERIRNVPPGKDGSPFFASLGTTFPRGTDVIAMSSDLTMYRMTPGTGRARKLYQLPTRSTQGGDIRLAVDGEHLLLADTTRDANGSATLTVLDLVTGRQLGHVPLPQVADDVDNDEGYVTVLPLPGLGTLVSGAAPTSAASR